MIPPPPTQQPELIENKSRLRNQIMFYVYNTYYRRGVSTNENIARCFLWSEKGVGQPVTAACYQPATAYLGIGWDIVGVNLAATCSILILNW